MSCSLAERAISHTTVHVFKCACDFVFCAQRPPWLVPSKQGTPTLLQYLVSTDGVASQSMGKRTAGDVDPRSSAAWAVYALPELHRFRDQERYRQRAGTAIIVRGPEVSQTPASIHSATLTVGIPSKDGAIILRDRRDYRLKGWGVMRRSRSRRGNRHGQPCHRSRSRNHRGRCRGW